MEPPTFPTRDPHTVRAAPGSDACLLLPAPSGTPPFHYEWSRAGASLDDRFTTSNDAGGVRLTVSAARTGDSGLYTLQASNAVGRDTARVRLDVAAEEAPSGDDPPTFLRRLQDLTVKVGTRTRFLVEIVSSTECKVTWYRNERRLMEAERVSLVRDGSFWCAELAAVSVDDAGRWTCSAENGGGRASCSAHLNVLVPKAYKRPEFVEELRALLTEQGTVSLECKVVGVPTPVLRWFKDSREIKAGDVFALTANAEDPTSLGTYTCEAVNCMGRAYSSSKVHVVGRTTKERAAAGVTPEPPPIFTKELEDRLVRVCEPLALGCSVMVPPWPRGVVWYNKDGKIEPGDRYHVVEDGVGGYLLEVSAAEWGDEGEWKCVATSAGGRVGISTCYVSMDVPKNYRKPRFMENLQAVLTEEGLVSFECKVVGFPTPVLSWFKDGQELKPGDVYQLTGTNSLGSYCCIARNCMGQASSSAELTVEDIQNQLNEDEKLQLFSKNQAPKFIQGLKSVEAKIDEPFRFTIKVAIPPEPSVLWYRDDQPVDESNRCHLSKEDRGAFNLDIQALELLDQAEWKCVAMNDFGHSVTSCFLKLIIPRHYKKPRFLENLQAILSEEGAVNLECKVIGVPQPVLKWYKDGEELKPGDIHRIISGQDGTCCLGTYTCEAQNCMGIAASSASLLGFDDSTKAKNKKKAEEQALQRNLSLSTIHEERTSQMYDTPVGDITLDDKGEISFSFDGKEVSVSLYETPDLTEEEALQIVEMYADQLSENVTEHNVVELPPLRFVKETSTSGNLLMEAIIIDVSPEYFASPEEDLRTEADVEDLSIADENGPPQLSLDQDVGGEDYLEKTMALLSDEKSDIPKKMPRKKSDSQRSADDFFSLSRDQSLSEERKDDDTQVLSESDLQSFASARSLGKPKSKLSKPSLEDGQESSDITKTILNKEEIQKKIETETVTPVLKPKRERRSSRSSRRSSSGSEKSFSKSGDEPKALKIQADMEQKPKKVSLSDEEFKEKITVISASLAKIINDVQIIERDIILKSELMSSAATASRSLEIISTLIKPLSEIQSIADVVKDSALECKEVSSTLFINLPQSLKSLHQSLTIVEKCIDVESDNKTLVKKTCVAFIETCGEEMKKWMNEIATITEKEYVIAEPKTMSEINSFVNEMNAVIRFSADTIKARNLLSEASEIKIEEPSIEAKHLRDTQKALFELKSPLNSLLCIVDTADSTKLTDVSRVKSSEVILNDMSASILDLQAALEQIEALSVKESTTSVCKYNTDIIETVMESILKLRSSFEQLSIEAKSEEDRELLKGVLISIKNNLSEISSQIQATENNVGSFDILQSENKLEILQKMAQILISLENSIPRLETIPKVKTHMDVFHKNLTKVLENVIESNDAKKYFTFMEVCDAVNRLNTSILNINTDHVLYLASINNTLSIVHQMFIKNVFESELNCSILSNTTDALLSVQEALNRADEISIQLDSEHAKNIPAMAFETSKANIIFEHIDQTIAIINTVKTMESTTDVKINVAPILENICPILEYLKRNIGCVRSEDIPGNEQISELSDASLVMSLATPLLELNQNMLTLNQVIIENLDSLKENTEIASAIAEPLHELYTTLQIIQQDVISQYDEDLTPYDVSINMVSAVQNLQSCIVMIEEPHAVEGIDEMSTLEDISGIKTTAETIPSDRLVLPSAEELNIQQSVESFDQEVFVSATAQTLQTLNEHIAVLQSPEVLDALDTLSEVSDYSSLKSVALGLGDLHVGIEEILHPLVVESSDEIMNLANINKLTAIAEPMQELHQSLSVLDANNIPIYEHILEMPTERINVVLSNIFEFKEYLSKCMEVVFPAMETADKTIEISNKVETLRGVCERLKDILHVSRTISSEVTTNQDIQTLEETVDNLLNATDVSRGIQIYEVKNVTEKLYEKIVTIQEDLIQYTPLTAENISDEAKLVQTIDEIESNIAVLEQYDFVDLSHVSQLTSCTTPQLAGEIDISSLIQMDDILQNAVNVVQDSEPLTSVADLMILEDFFVTCKNEFTMLRHIITKTISHKKIIRLIQEFGFLQKLIKDFQVKSQELKFSEDINSYISTFFVQAGDNLGTVQKLILKLLDSQSELLFKGPADKIETVSVSLKDIVNQQTVKTDAFDQVIIKFVDIIDLLKPKLRNLQEHLTKEIMDLTTETPEDDSMLFKELDCILKIVEVQCSSTSLNYINKNILLNLFECLQKHQNYKDATGSGKYLIVSKCVCECGDILQNITASTLSSDKLTARKEKVEDNTLKAVLNEMLEPLQALRDQIISIQEKVCSNTEEDSVSLDLTTTESIVETMTEIHKGFKEQIESLETGVAAENISLIMEADKEIHAIQDSLKLMENVPAVKDLKEITKPIECVEKTLHSILSKEDEKEIVETLPKGKLPQILQHVEQYIELLEVVEETGVILKIDKLKETVDIARELRDSLLISEQIISEETGELQLNLNNNQTQIALKLQEALSTLHLQVLDTSSEILPEKKSDFSKRVVQATSCLRDDLVALSSTQVATTVPLSEIVTEKLSETEALSEPVETVAFQPVGSYIPDDTSSAVLKKEVSIIPKSSEDVFTESTSTFALSEDIQNKLEKEDAVQASLTTNDALQKSEVVAFENVELVKQEMVSKESQGMNIAVACELTPAESLLVKEVELLAGEQIPDIQVAPQLDDQATTTESPLVRADESYKQEEIIPDQFKHYIEDFISENILEAINELSLVTNVEELRQSIRIATELRENFEAIESTAKLDASESLESLQANQNQLAQKLQNALSIAQEQLFDDLQNLAPVDESKIQQVADVTLNLQTSLATIVTLTTSADIKEIQPFESVMPTTGQVEESITLSDKVEAIVTEELSIVMNKDVSDDKASEKLDTYVIDNIKIETEIVKPKEQVQDGVQELHRDTLASVGISGEDAVLVPEVFEITAMISDQDLPKIDEKVVATVTENDVFDTSKLKSTPVFANIEEQKMTLVPSDLLQHIEEFLSDEITEAIEELSLRSATDLKKTVHIAKELRENVVIANASVSVEEISPLDHETQSQRVQITEKLSKALNSLLTNVLENAQELTTKLPADKIEKISDIVTHLQEDLKAIAITAVVQSPPNEALSESTREESMKQLEDLLRDVSDRIDLSSGDRSVEDTEVLRDSLDEIQTVIIKLKRDFDGAANDTLNETLEDLECSVRSVQLQITEESPPDLLKEACATLQLLVNNMSETQEVKVSETEFKEIKTKDVLEKCSDETEQTMQLLDIASHVDIAGRSHLSDIVSNLNNLRNTMKSLKTGFSGNSDTLIEKGIDIIQHLDQIEEKVFSIEKDVDSEINLPSHIRDNIITAVHSVYGSISNMRSTISSIQKQYMFENYGKPSENFLKSIKNISYLCNSEAIDQPKFKKMSKSLRSVLNHFEDIKFYINLDKTARLPSDAAFTKIILEELKSNMELISSTDGFDSNTKNKIEKALKCVEIQLHSVETRSSLEVKEKIPIFKELSLPILDITKHIKNNLSYKQESVTKKAPDTQEIKMTDKSTPGQAVQEATISQASEKTQIDTVDDSSQDQSILYSSNEKDKIILSTLVEKMSESGTFETGVPHTQAKITLLSEEKEEKIDIVEPANLENKEVICDFEEATAFESAIEQKAISGEENQITDDTKDFERKKDEGSDVAQAAVNLEQSTSIQTDNVDKFDMLAQLEEKDADKDQQYSKIEMMQEFEAATKTEEVNLIQDEDLNFTDMQKHVEESVRKVPEKSTLKSEHENNDAEQVEAKPFEIQIEEIESKNKENSDVLIEEQKSDAEMSSKHVSPTTVTVENEKTEREIGRPKVNIEEKTLKEKQDAQLAKDEKVGTEKAVVEELKTAEKHEGSPSCFKQKMEEQETFLEKRDQEEGRQLTQERIEIEKSEEQLQKQEMEKKIEEEQLTEQLKEEERLKQKEEERDKAKICQQEIIKKLEGKEQKHHTEEKEGFSQKLNQQEEAGLQKDLKRGIAEMESEKLKKKPVDEQLDQKLEREDELQKAEKSKDEMETPKVENKLEDKQKDEEEFMKVLPVVEKQELEMKSKEDQKLRKQQEEKEELAEMAADYKADVEVHEIQDNYREEKEKKEEEAIIQHRKVEEEFHLKQELEQREQLEKNTQEKGDKFSDDEKVRENKEKQKTDDLEGTKEEEVKKKKRGSKNKSQNQGEEQKQELEKKVKKDTEQESFIQQQKMDDKLRLKQELENKAKTEKEQHDKEDKLRVQTEKKKGEEQALVEEQKNEEKLRLKQESDEKERAEKKKAKRESTKKDEEENKSKEKQELAEKEQTEKERQEKEHGDMKQQQEMEEDLKQKELRQKEQMEKKRQAIEKAEKEQKEKEQDDLLQQQNIEKLQPKELQQKEQLEKARQERENVEKEQAALIQEQKIEEELQLKELQQKDQLKKEIQERERVAKEKEEKESLIQHQKMEEELRLKEVLEEKYQLEKERQDSESQIRVMAEKNENEEQALIEQQNTEEEMRLKQEAEEKVKADKEKAVIEKRDDKKKKQEDKVREESKKLLEKEKAEREKKEKEDDALMERKEREKVEKEKKEEKIEEELRLRQELEHKEKLEKERQEKEDELQRENEALFETQKNEEKIRLKQEAEKEEKAEKEKAKREKREAKKKIQEEKNEREKKTTEKEKSEKEREREALVQQQKMEEELRLKQELAQIEKLEKERQEKEELRVKQEEGVKEEQALVEKQKVEEEMRLKQEAEEKEKEEKDKIKKEKRESKKMIQEEKEKEAKETAEKEEAERERNEKDQEALIQEKNIEEVLLLKQEPEQKEKLDNERKEKEKGMTEKAQEAILQQQKKDEELQLEQQLEQKDKLEKERQEKELRVEQEKRENDALIEKQKTEEEMRLKQEADEKKKAEQEKAKREKRESKRKIQEEEKKEKETVEKEKEEKERKEKEQKALVQQQKVEEDLLLKQELEQKEMLEKERKEIVEKKQNALVQQQKIEEDLLLKQELEQKEKLEQERKEREEAEKEIVEKEQNALVQQQKMEEELRIKQELEQKEQLEKERQEKEDKLQREKEALNEKQKNEEEMRLKQEAEEKEKTEKEKVKREKRDSKKKIQEEKEKRERETEEKARAEKETKEKEQEALVQQQKMEEELRLKQKHEQKQKVEKEREEKEELQVKQEDSVKEEQALIDKQKIEEELHLKQEAEEKERSEKEKIQKEKIESEKKIQDEKQKMEKETAEKEKAERVKKEKEQEALVPQQKMEEDLLLKQELEQKEKLENERKEREKVEKEQEAIVQQQKIKEELRLKQALEQKEKLENERQEKENKLQREKEALIEKQKNEEEMRLKQEAQEKAEKEEKEKAEKEKAKIEKRESKKKFQEEKEKKEKETAEKEKAEKEKKEKEQEALVQQQKMEEDLLLKQEHEQEQKLEKERQEKEELRIKQEVSVKKEQALIEKQKSEEEMRLKQEAEEKEKAGKEKIKREKRESKKKIQEEKEKKEKETAEKEEAERQEKEQETFVQQQKMEENLLLKQELEQKETLENERKEMEKVEKVKIEKEQEAIAQQQKIKEELRLKQELEQKEQLEKERQEKEDKLQREKEALIEKQKNEEEMRLKQEAEETEKAEKEKAKREKRELKKKIQEEKEKRETAEMAEKERREKEQEALVQQHKMAEELRLKQEHKQKEKLENEKQEKEELRVKQEEIVKAEQALIEKQKVEEEMRLKQEADGKENAEKEKIKREKREPRKKIQEEKEKKEKERQDIEQEDLLGQQNVEEESRLKLEYQHKEQLENGTQDKEKQFRPDIEKSQKEKQRLKMKVEEEKTIKEKEQEKQINEKYALKSEKEKQLANQERKEIRERIESKFTEKKREKDESDVIIKKRTSGAADVEDVRITYNQKFDQKDQSLPSIAASQHYIKEYHYEPTGRTKSDDKEMPRFIDHNHRDYTMEFIRPSGYRERSFDIDNLAPEWERNGKSPTIYKAGSLRLDAQLRSSLPPQPQVTKSSELIERRSEARLRSKALSEARSILSEKRSSVSRDIKRKPVFSTYLTDRTAVEGSRVKLTCSVLSSGDPKVTWYKNGVLLDNKLKYRTKIIDGLITLEVLNAVPSDSAEYGCMVENENGSVNTSANLKVYPSFEASPIPPTFTRSIRDTFHLAENELVLECRIRGQPLPTITWLKDDRPVSSDDRFQAYYLADGVCRLAISHPTREDSGKYTCKAENSVWSDQITHVVSFTGRESRLSPNLATVEKSRMSRQSIESRRPHFGNVLTDYKVTTGGTIGLQVEIKGYPTRVEWLREGRSVTDTYTNARTIVEQGLYTLALSDVTERESGLYTCRAFSSHGAVDMNAAITVVQPNEIEGKPAIIIGRPEKDILISIGEDINISFRVHGEPKPKVIFMKGIRDITNSQRVCKMTSDDYVKFTVKRSVISDAGTYCILARNAYGCDRAFVTVVIRQRASSEHLISDWTYPIDDSALSIVERKYKSVPERIPGEPSVVDGGNNWVSLAWPKPDPSVAAPVLAYKVESWLSGKEGGARWTELGITPLNSFDVFNLKQGEEYHFRVTPRNRYGWGESVQTSTPIGVGSAGDRPEFVDCLPGQLKVLVGHTASLGCSVKGKPTPEVVWMKNGHEIEDEERRVRSSFNGYDCNLTIEDITIEDEARYSCEASNAHGRASTYVRLAVVTDRLVWEADAKLKRERSADVAGDYPPQFTMRLRDRRVQATYPVRLTCQVVGSPPPALTWYKDGQEVILDGRHTKSQDEQFHTLEIAPTTLEDGGVYEAMARNSCGAISCRCSLVVDKGIRAYVAPEFCCGLEPLYRLHEGEELRISAVVEAYPSVGVTWYRDGVRLRPSRRAVMTLDRDGQTELALAAVTPRDAGAYACTASNEVGRATTSGKVVVIGDGSSSDKTSPPVLFSPDVPYSKEPMFVRKPRSSEAREGDTVVIQCEVVGDPKPDLYWLRDFLKPDYYRDATHFKRIGEGPAYQLEIPHAKLDYTGAYSVVARNAHGEAKAIISLQILAKDISSTEEHNISYGRVEVIPRFERELTDLLCHDGDAVEFHCQVSGDPEPDIRWFHYTELIRECPDFEWSYEDGAARFKIKQVTAEDEGTYLCEATNRLGKATSGACLVVYPPGEPNTLSQRLRRPPALLSAASTPRSTPRTTPARSVSRTPGPDARRLCSPSRQMAPKFYTYPFNKVVEEGENVVFKCAVRGLPAPWATWDKDGVIVTPSARITIKEKDEILRILEIDEVTIEDVGLYRITLENDYGRVEASARLEVITQKGKFYAGVRSYSASPRRALARRRPCSRQD